MSIPQSLRLFILFNVLLMGLISVGDAQRPAAQARVKDTRTPLMQAVIKGNLEQVKQLCEAGADIEARDAEGQTALFWAVAVSYNTYGDMLTPQVEDKQTEIGEFLMERGANINAPTSNGMTPLMRAVGWHQPKFAGALLARGADIHLRDKWGRTALTWGAPLGRRYPLVQTLLQKGAKIGFTDALLLKDFPQAKALLKSGTEINVRGPYRDTPLMIAAEEGELEIARELLHRGAAVNERDERGMTALLLAVAGRATVYLPSGHTEWRTDHPKARLQIVDALLTREADPNIATLRSNSLWESRKYGETPLMRAVNLGKTEIARLLLTPRTKLELKNSEGDTALHYAINYAIKDKSSEAVALLLKAGANVNARNKIGDTPLLKAAGEDNLAVVKMLLKHGANVNAANKYGETPLLRGGDAISLTLLQHGAKITRMPDGYSALTLALWQKSGWNRSNALINILRKRGAPITLLDAILMNDLPLVQKKLKEPGSLKLKGPNSMTPLSLAAEYSRPEIVEALLSHGAKPEEVSGLLHDTPLLNAVERTGITLYREKWSSTKRAQEEQRCLRVVQILLDQGADINRQDAYPNNTALMIAAEYGLTPIVRFLLSRGAKVDIKNNEDKTALQLATQNRHKEIVTLLQQPASKP